MPGGSKKRTAYVLYAVLLVLPTLVLGGLQWRQLVLEHEAELAAVPRRAEDAARRLVDATRERLQRLLESENRRPFYHYGALYSPAEASYALGDEPIILPSPLDREPRPAGLVAWFNFEPFLSQQALQEGGEPELDVHWGRSRSRSGSEPDVGDAPRNAEEAGNGAGASIQAALDYMERSLEEGALVRATRIEGLEAPQSIPLASVAVNRGHRRHLDCLRRCLPMLLDRRLPVTQSRFHLQFYREPDGTPRVVATRRAFFFEDLPELPPEADCIREPLADGFALVQGFFIDPEWLFRELPAAVSGQVLADSERFVAPGDPDIVGRREYRAQIDLMSALDLQSRPEDILGMGRAQVGFDQAVLERRQRAQRLRFLGVAAMLALSLATGMLLLVRTVSREVEQAQRMENFVASVTHELRTPLSAIKLHGEMLLEGWAKDPEQRAEYYRRIVRETERLSILVERVLEQSSITRGTSRPEPGDLNATLTGIARDLELLPDESAGEAAAEADGEAGSRAVGPAADDLAFDLADDLPPVMLTREAVAGFLVNLVENARKYAPVDRDRPGWEPIRVVTRRAGGEVLLEVADRGPGVPAEERESVFEAFYRLGNESTRTSKGTGLGLHLVGLHARAIGARVEVLDNPGGGALFRVRFAPAA